MRRLLSLSPTSNAERTLEGIHHRRIHLYPWISLPQFIVENLSHDLRVTKDASGHGHRDNRLLREQSLNHHSSNPRQFPSRFPQNLTADFILTASHSREQRRKIRRRNRVRCPRQIQKAANSPTLIEPLD